LAERKDAWERGQRAVTVAAQCATVPAQKGEDPYRPAGHAQVLQHVLRRLDRACANCLRRVTSGAGQAG